MIHDSAAGGLGDAGGDDSRAGAADDLADLALEGLCDVAGDVLGGRIETIEGGCAVEVGVLEGAGDLGEEGLDPVEVDEEAVGVEGVAGKGDGDVPVVAVVWLALTGDEEGVCRGEGGFDGEGEHSRDDREGRRRA